MGKLCSQSTGTLPQVKSEMFSCLGLCIKDDGGLGVKDDGGLGIEDEGLVNVLQIFLNCKYYNFNVIIIYV